MGVYLSTVTNRLKNSLKIGKQEPFGHIGTYELTNVLAYQSTWGVNFLRDITSTTNSGSVASSEGSVVLSTGTSPGSTAKDRTVERGQYQPGKATETGIAASLNQVPTDDMFAEIGLRDESNGAFYRIDSNGLHVARLRSNTEIFINQSNFNIDKLDGKGPSKHTFDPSLPYIYGVRFTWYGVGKFAFILWIPSDDPRTEMREIVVHTYYDRNSFPSIVDPNLPLDVRVNNGTTNKDLKAFIGGRRYDILGQFLPERRNSGARRSGQTVSGLTPLIAVKRLDEFPQGSGRENSVNAYLDSFEIITDADIYLYAAADTTGSLDGTFNLPTYHTSGNTALNYSTNSTTFSFGEFLRGPYLLEGGSGRGNSRAFNKTKGDRIPLVGSIPTVLVAEPVSGTATVTCVLRTSEEW